MRPGRGGVRLAALRALLCAALCAPLPAAAAVHTPSRRQLLQQTEPEIVVALPDAPQDSPPEEPAAPATPAPTDGSSVVLPPGVSAPGPGEQDDYEDIISGGGGGASDTEADLPQLGGPPPPPTPFAQTPTGGTLLAVAAVAGFLLIVLTCCSCYSRTLERKRGTAKAEIANSTDLKNADTGLVGTQSSMAAPPMVQAHRSTFHPSGAAAFASSAKPRGGPPDSHFSQPQAPPPSFGSTAEDKLGLLDAGQFVSPGSASPGKLARGRGSVADLYREESSLFFPQQSEFGTEEGLYVASVRNGMLDSAKDADLAEIRRLASEHLSENDARRVTVVPESQQTIARTLSESAASLTGGSGPLEPLTIVERQLDWLQTSKKGILFGKYRLEGRTGRRKGGQGIVAFAAAAKNAGERYAIKFYTSPSAFTRERAAILAPSLQHAMPACHAIVGDVTSINEGPLAGSVLPPIIITERGEPLSDYVHRSHPDAISCMQIIIQIARKLQVMHQAGFAHRDLKPGNTIWLPSSNAWSLIDFGCTAKCGTQVGLSFSLLYAAPETVHAFKAGRKTVAASAAVDAFAFGIMCVELLTHKPYYPKGLSGRQVGDMLDGEAALPHESFTPDREKRLGKLRTPIMQLLHRDPAARLSVSSFVTICEDLFCA